MKKNIFNGMTVIEKSFESSTKKIEYLFEIEFRKNIELQLMEFYPEFHNNNLDSYEILLEFDILKETDPDLDYIFREVKKNINRISSFFHEYRIDENGKLRTTTSFQSREPVIQGIDFLFGEKFIVKSFFRFDN